MPTRLFVTTALLTCVAAPMVPVGSASVYVPLAVTQAGEAAPAPDANPAPELSQEELGERAFKVLETTCMKCHGVGKRQGRKMLIDRKGYKTLVEEQKQVIPGDPSKSSLYTRMIDPVDPMPPANAEPKPTKAEVDLIRAWIEKGAPAWKAEAPAAP